MSALSSTEVLDHLTGSYHLDPAHTRLGFAARYALVTRVHGWFDSFDGRLHLDGSDPTRCSVVLTIDAASIRTNNVDRDAHLRSGDFFDVERYPTITFESTAVQALANHRYRVTGDLTIKATTRPVDVDLTYSGSCVDPYQSTSRRHRRSGLAEAQRVGPDVERGARGRRSGAQRPHRPRARPVRHQGLNRRHRPAV